MPGKTEVKETQTLPRHYHPPGREVSEFISRHPHLLTPLCEAPAHIFSIFGGDTELTLELHKDPEEVYYELFVIIKTKRVDAVELLEKLDKWFFQFTRDVDNKLNFTVEAR